jgi:hypothetical protein
MIIGHPGTWQQFQFRPDNKGLNVMEMKSKYLHEQYLFEAQMLNLQQMQQQNLFMNGVGGGGPLSSSEPEPEPPAPTYLTEIQFYFDGTEAEVANELGWDPRIPSSWRDNAFDNSGIFDVLEIGGDGISTFTVTLKNNNEYNTGLKQDAFDGITRLTRVTDVNDNFIIEVGARCFLNCTALTDVQLNAVITVNDQSFNSCTALESVSFTNLETIPNGNNTGQVLSVFNNCPLNNLDFELNFPLLQTIGDYAFHGCGGFRKILSSTISSIGFRAFAQASSGLSQLDEVNISCVTSIGDRAFQNVNALTTISLPYDNTYHPDAFSDVGAGFGEATFNLADEDDPAFDDLSGWNITYV